MLTARLLREEPAHSGHELSIVLLIKLRRQLPDNGLDVCILFLKHGYLEVLPGVLRQDSIDLRLRRKRRVLDHSEVILQLLV